MKEMVNDCPDLPDKGFRYVVKHSHKVGKGRNSGKVGFDHGKDNEKVAFEYGFLRDNKT